MQHTLVAVFDNRSDAQNAVDELLASGFPRTDVNLSSADPTGQTDSLTGVSGENRDGVHEEGIGASIKHFFTGLFGSDSDEHASRYSDAVTRGHHVLTLTTDSEPEVERAADIIERFGPVDIDERHDLSGSASTLGSSAYSPGAMGASSGMQQSAPLSAQSANLQSDSLQSGSHSSQSGSLQRDDDLPYPAKQDLDDAVPRGTTYQETQSGSLQSGSLGSGNLQGSASLQGSDDASLGGTIQRDNLSGSQQRDVLTGSQQRDMSTMRTERDTGAAIPVVQEDLKIGKREVQRGGVRVFSRVVETPVDQNINLREEHVSVERRPVDQPISPSDATAFKEQSIELREKAEEAVVQKTARVVEEVVVGKEVSQRQEHIQDTVRRTEVEIENLAGDRSLRGGSMDDDTYFRNDWQTNYSSLGGSYDDYAPAYRYGTEARSRYAGRDWDDIESDLRSDWDTRYGSSGGSTWEKMKAAVRRGWDKITPDSRDDDSYFRSDWQSNYSSLGGSYDDYAPAYRYGTEARSRYAGRDWDDVESDLRSDWDTRYGSSGGSTWEKMKAAVRRGWDKITPDMDDDDAYYRNHWTSTYGTSGDTYNDYAPAYRYGTEARSRYAGRDWDDVESDLRSDWDTRYSSGGPSTWDRMKAAVRHGWDRMTS